MTNKYTAVSKAGSVFNLARDQCASLVLQLHGGGFSEKQTRDTMIVMGRLDDGKEIKLNGWKIIKEKSNGANASTT